MGEFLSRGPDSSFIQKLQKADVVIVYPLNREIEEIVVVDFRVSQESAHGVDLFLKQELLSPELIRQIEIQFPSGESHSRNDTERLVREAVMARLKRQRPEEFPGSMIATFFTVTESPYFFSDNIRTLISTLGQNRIDPESWQRTLRTLRAGDRLRASRATILGDPPLATIWQKPA